MERKTVLITGISGYIGTVFCRQLRQSRWCERIVGFDVNEPAEPDRIEFRQMDVCDAELADWVAEIKPDILVHLAFVLDPIRDEHKMRRINVDGTRNVLQAAAKAKVPQVMVASSATAYGAWPENPVPIKESHPLKQHRSFRYAIDKYDVEALCQTFMENHPEVSFSIIRPCVVYGPGVDNFLSYLLTGLPVVAAPAGCDPPLQFVHEDDVAAAMVAILENAGSGPFNVAPPSTLELSEVIRFPKKLSLRMPVYLMTWLLWLAWRIVPGLFRMPSTIIDYYRYPWVVDCTRLGELGFEFSHSTRDTLAAMLRAKGIAIRSDP